ncbi:MIP18 family protein [Babesia ovis]|uniref:MIP18 family protein n=1 Tax=Babesia ovis TaxID=5869 RepID=A0A9W5WU16_BABOV|nr:MIP18 family protein [Babesia ovis]
MDNANPVIYKSSHSLSTTDSQKGLLENDKASSIFYIDKRSMLQEADKTDGDRSNQDLFQPSTHYEEFDATEIFNIIRDIKDPEYSYTLETLKIVEEDYIHIDHENSIVTVMFTPTVPHCSQATIIGLMIYVKLQQSLPPQFKIDVQISQDNNSGQIPANLTDEDIINMRVALAQENTMGIDFVKTIEMLQTSPHCTVSPKTIAYNAVLSAAERNSNAQLALAVLDDMRKKENVVDAVSCRIALVTCAKCGYTNEALELYDEMVRNKYPIDHGVMRSIMATLANDGRAIECLNIFNDMKNLDKIAQNDETFVRLDDYLKVIEACTKGYMYEDGLQKYRELKKTKLYRLTPELIDKVLHLCSAMDNYTDAMDIYGDMLKEDGPLSTYQCKLLMTIFYMARKHTPVESVYNYMRQRGIPVDSGNYQIVLETYARTGQYQKALDIIKVMESEGLLKNTYVPFIAAAESCRQSGEWKLAIQLLRRANEHNAHKSIDMYNVVLAVCATAEEWDTIISLYAEITNVIDKEKEAPTGFSMNGDTIAHILMAYFYTDDLEQVKKLLKLPVVDTPLLLKLRRNIETRHTEASTKEG